MKNTDFILKEYEEIKTYDISKCPYCHNDDHLKIDLIDDGYGQVYILGQHLRLLHPLGIATFKIHFCPICGREL